MNLGRGGGEGMHPLKAVSTDPSGMITHPSRGWGRVGGMSPGEPGVRSGKRHIMAENEDREACSHVGISFRLGNEYQVRYRR